MKKSLKTISDTSVLSAGCRALENKRKDRLFKDPYSKVLIPNNRLTLFNQFQDTELFPAFYNSVVVRTHVLDKRLVKKLRKNNIRQVVNLGSGLDTRPYRLALPDDILWWELDLPEMIHYKRSCMKKESANCRIQYYPVDFTKIENLHKFCREHLTSSYPTLILSEGLLAYLPKSIIKNILWTFSRNKNVVRWITDIGTPKNRPELVFDDQTIYKELLDNMPGFLEIGDPIFSQNGWQVRSSKDLAIEAIKYNRGFSVKHYKNALPNPIDELRSLKWSKLLYVLSLENCNTNEVITSYPVTNSPDFKGILSKAMSLTQRYGPQLITGEIPSGLSLIHIQNWQNKVSSSRFSLRDRIALFQKVKPFGEQNTKDKWLETFKTIVTYYSEGEEYPESSHIDQKKHRNSRIEDLLFPFTAYLEKELLTIQDEYSSFLSPDAIKNHLIFLEKILKDYSAFCLAENYQLFLRHSKLKPRKRSFEDYKQNFKQSLGLDFFREYGVLAKFLTTQCERWLHSFVKIVQRFNQDKDFIAKEFFNGSSQGTIVKFQMDPGPPNSKEGYPVILTFESSEKLVYKPRSAGSDLIYHSLIKWINQKKPSLKFRFIKVIDKVDYSWHEYIEHRECKQTNEIENFYERMGFLSGILDMLGSRDYHFGNIIADGEFPMLVDHETLLSHADKMDQHHVGKAKILVSGNNKKINNKYNLLGAFHRKAKLKIKTVTIKKAKVVYSDKKLSWRGKNTPKLKGKYVNPNEFHAEIIHGYDSALKFLNEHKDPFYEFLRSRLKENPVLLRYIFRPSLEYLQLLLHSLQPEFMRSGVDRSIHFERIFKKLAQLNANQINLTIIMSELQCLEDYTIPRFNIYSDSLQLETIQSSENLFELTPIEFIHKHLLSFENKSFIKDRVRLLKNLLLERK